MHAVPRKALLAALALVAILTGLIPVVQSAAGGNSTPMAVPITRLVPCEGTPVVRPHREIIACADANWYLTDIHWVRWASSAAVGRAVDHLNACSPDCADGTFHTVPTVVVLSDPVDTSRWGPLFSVASILDAHRLQGSDGATHVLRLMITPLH